MILITRVLPDSPSTMKLSILDETGWVQEGKVHTAKLITRTKDHAIYWCGHTAR